MNTPENLHQAIRLIYSNQEAAQYAGVAPGTFSKCGVQYSDEWTKSILRRCALKIISDVEALISVSEETHEVVFWEGYIALIKGKM